MRNKAKVCVIHTQLYRRGDGFEFVFNPLSPTEGTWMKGSFTHGLGEGICQSCHDLTSKLTHTDFQFLYTPIEEEHAS